MNGILRCAIRTRSVVTACSLSAALLVPLQANAQEVTLRSTNDASINMTGDFVSLVDNVYTIDTNLGLINIRGTDIECIGEACPGVAISVVTGPIVWDVSLWGSRRAFTEHVEKLAELVDEKTEGQLTLNLSYGGLGPSREDPEGLRTGEGRGGEECRSRGSPDHLKKKKNGHTVRHE